jgi:type VI secretion system protein VasD
VFLFACSSGSKKPPAAEPVPVKRTIVTATDLNPDPEGKASPVVLMVYQLRETGAFQNADFFSLYDQPSRTLGPDLVARPEELKLRPDQKREFETEIDEETRHLGVVVAFREIERARWRAVAEIPEKKKKWLFLTSKKPVELGIDVQSLTVDLTIERP